MKTNVETVSGVEKRITVEIPAEVVGERVEEGFAEIRRMVPIRGFRRGKAPMSMVKRFYKEAVEGDVAEKLVKDSLSEAVENHKLRVLSMPKIDGGKLVEGADFVFTATVEVAPEVEPKDYRGIPVVKEKVEVREADVESSLSRLREAFAQYHPVEGRGAAEGDLVELDYAVRAGDEELERKENFGLVLTGGVPFGKEFEEKVAGAGPGEARSFAIAFPADFVNPKFAGKEVSFEVAVKAVREKKLPELDDELAKNFGDVANLDELKDRIRERLLNEGEERSRLRAEEDLRNGLVERNPFEVPPTMVERQTWAMIQDTAQRLASQGVDLRNLNMDPGKMRERFAPNAEKAVRVSLLLEAIAKKENLDVSYSEMEAEMKTMAAAMNMEFEKVREMYGDEDRLDHLRSRLLDRKTMSFLLENAQVTEEVAP